MKKIIPVLIFLLLTSCAGSEQAAKDFHDLVKFGPDESGCVSVIGNIGGVTVIYKKQKGEGNFTC